MNHITNLRATVYFAKGSADFHLNFQAINENGEPVGEVAFLNTSDPTLQEKLKLICQAYRMGTRFGEETFQ